MTGEMLRELARLARLHDNKTGFAGAPGLEDLSSPVECALMQHKSFPYDVRRPLPSGCKPQKSRKNGGLIFCMRALCRCVLKEWTQAESEPLG